MLAELAARQVDQTNMCVATRLFQPDASQIVQCLSQ